MKHFFQISLVIILLTSASLFSQTDITILYLGDTHSCLSPLGPRNVDLSGTQGGIARAVSVIAPYEMSGENVLTLHSGDFSTGDFFFGIPLFSPGTPLEELNILREVGVDAITLGNHEFDLGPNYLLYELSTAFPDPATAIPFLSANAQNISAVPGLDQYVQPYIIKTFNGVKVGIFGLTIHETNTMSNPAPIVFEEDFITRAAITAGTLQALGCQFIICLSHYGILGDEALATYVPNINLIVGGHDHYLIPPFKIGNTWITQAESYYKYIGKITFNINGEDVTMTGNEMIALDSNIPEAPSIKNVVDYLISEIEAGIGPVYTQQVATSVQFQEELATNILSPGNHTTAAGNFVSDAMKWRTGTDFAIEPDGSIAHPIYKGPIVPADLFRTVGYGFWQEGDQMGMGFKVVTFDISGMELYTAMETLLTMIDVEDFLPQFSGLKLKYIPDAPFGQRVKSIMINNKQLNPLLTYTVSSNQLVTMMLDLFGIQYTNLSTKEYTEFENLLAYVNYLHNKITPDREARVLAVGNSINKDCQLAEVPSEYSLEQNYPNPFNPSTTIQFNLPKDSKVRLTISNILGEEVTVLVDEYKSAGSYKVDWNAASASAGVYFYNLQTEGYSQTRKMILLK